jgi:hypothetical protein
VSSRSSRSSCSGTSLQFFAVRSPRPCLENADRVFLAAASRLLRGTGRQSFFVSPEHVAGLASPACSETLDQRGRRPGRPAISAGDPKPGRIEGQALENLRDPRLRGVLRAISTLQAEIAAALASLHAPDANGDAGG